MTHDNQFFLSLQYQLEGKYIATTSKDRQLIIWDPRQKTKAFNVEAHGGNKNLKLSWAGENSIITTGWNTTHQREMKLWDIRNNDSYIMKTQLDNLSGVIHTF